MLHTVNKSPLSGASLRTCLNYAQPNDSILLIEDGVYAALSEGAHAQLMNNVPDSTKLYALLPDLMARGLLDKPLLARVETVDYSGFVRLATENDKVQSWL